MEKNKCMAEAGGMAMFPWTCSGSKTSPCRYDLALVSRLGCSPMQDHSPLCWRYRTGLGKPYPWDGIPKSVWGDGSRHPVEGIFPPTALWVSISPWTIGAWPKLQLEAVKFCTKWEQEATCDRMSSLSHLSRLGLGSSGVVKVVWGPSELVGLGGTPRQPGPSRRGRTVGARRISHTNSHGLK